LHTYTKHASMHARRASQRCVLQFGLCTKCTCRRLRAEHDRWDMAMQCCTGYVPLTRLEHCTRTVHVHAALHRRTHARRQTAVNAHSSFAWPNSESAQSYVMQLHARRLNATCIIACMNGHALGTVLVESCGRVSLSLPLPHLHQLLCVLLPELVGHARQERPVEAIQALDDNHGAKRGREADWPLVCSH
jgi:hypothetical protein